MCPEKELLSAYYDEELESPWRERIQNHLKICEDCRKKIDEFKQMSLFLNSDPEPLSMDAMSRVRDRIQHPDYKWNSHIWERKVTLPMPVLALAAAVLMVIGFIFVYRIAAPPQPQSQVTVSTDNSGRTELQISAPIQDMESLIKLLEGHDSFEEVIFQLPSEDQIWKQGEPELIRAVDFKRKGE